MRPTPERTLEYGTNNREDLFKVIHTILTNHMPLAEVPGYSALDMGQKRGIKAALDNFADVIVHLAFLNSPGQVNPVHRPVVEQLMVDLQTMLDKMPAEERPDAWKLADESARAAGARKAQELQNRPFKVKTGICEEHGKRLWTSRPGVLRAWCGKELPDGTECGLEIFPEPAKPEGMFHNA